MFSFVIPICYNKRWMKNLPRKLVCLVWHAFNVLDSWKFKKDLPLLYYVALTIWNTRRMNWWFNSLFIFLFFSLPLLTTTRTDHNKINKILYFNLGWDAVELASVAMTFANCDTFVKCVTEWKYPEFINNCCSRLNGTDFISLVQCQFFNSRAAFTVCVGAWTCEANRFPFIMGYSNYNPANKFIMANKFSVEISWVNILIILHGLSIYLHSFKKKIL